ncbi:AraC family transcriptional regulator [Myroides sp. N17-2]|uniref:helix-turn-helix domain-containing protein n=1 Tax=Myroides sp. N17-2 TaxID=2030799 RepID=UPI000EFDABDB|nr:AraC family transcriptional regulator [Myroides sp. N17-2]
MKQQDDLFGIQKVCYTKNNKSGEQFIKTTGICIILSGKLEAYDGVTKYLYQEGDIILFKKNTLIRFVKYASVDKPFESISIVFKEEQLKDFALKNNISSTIASTDSLYKLTNTQLIKNFFQFLQQWFNYPITKTLITLKKEEILHLILLNNPIYSNVLFLFDTPGKINLEAFMNNNFRFNVPLVQFAFLTGRSLATFKRDFEKIFYTSPNKWLQQKRLEEAYFLLKEKKMKTKDVYMEIGFETLSHFSFAFKKQFGITPTALRAE